MQIPSHLRSIISTQNCNIEQSNVGCIARGYNMAFRLWGYEGLDPYVDIPPHIL